MKTAVEWLVEQMRLRRDEGLSLSFYDLEMFAKKAKQMEKEQAILFLEEYDSYVFRGGSASAEEYYNETFIESE